MARLRILTNGSVRPQDVKVFNDIDGTEISTHDMKSIAILIDADHVNRCTVTYFELDEHGHRKVDFEREDLVTREETHEVAVIDVVAIVPPELDDAEIERLRKLTGDADLEGDLANAREDRGPA